MWSPGQEEALASVQRWLNDPDGRQVFRLFGYAGTGKTTIAKEIATYVTGTVLFATFTGKAAQVLRNKGCDGATTIHSLIYNVKEKGRTKLSELEQSLLDAKAAGDHLRVALLDADIRQERKALSNPSFSLGNGFSVQAADLIIIDECSMVDAQMGSDLLSFKKRVLVLGDPAQLPPIMGGGFFTEGHRPDFMLTEIHRQALDNPILAMATKVRQNEPLPFGEYGSSRVISRSSLRPGESLEYDQVLVGKNVTRRQIIHRFRDALGYPNPFPMVGEKLICLRNNHDKGLLNGSMWRSKSTTPGTDGDTILIDLEGTDDDTQISTIAHKSPFLGEEMTMPWWERIEADELDYGYAITVHKSQGSEFGSVLLVDEWRMRDSRQRWLYTALTRASERITVVRS